jgi:hypothetical protein
MRRWNVGLGVVVAVIGPLWGCEPVEGPEGQPVAGPSSGAGPSGTTGSGNCATYDDQSQDLPVCGVPSGEVDCTDHIKGYPYGCTGVCGLGPACYPSPDCCVESCSAWGADTVCGDYGKLQDADQTVAACDQGFAFKHATWCDDANPDWTCCTPASAPSFLCPPGTACAALDGGGFCCSSQQPCVGDFANCGQGQTCCSAFVCDGRQCHPPDFVCKGLAEPCALGELGCCEGLKCYSMDAGNSFQCWEDPGPTQN